MSDGQKPDEDFQYANPQIEALIKDIGGALKQAMPKGWGFSLMIFSYGEDGGLFYVASAKRDDMVRVYREFLQKQDIEAGTDETAANVIGRLINHMTTEGTVEDHKADWDEILPEAMRYLMRAKREHPRSAKEFWERAKRDGLVT